MNCTIEQRASVATPSKYCPVCGQPGSRRCQGYLARCDELGRAHMYYVCPVCGSIYLEPALLAAADGGEALVTYTREYWREECEAARERCYGPSLARLAEAVYYCRIPIRRLLDIGTGTGHLLDAAALYAPALASRLYGVEKFPPCREERSVSPRMFYGDPDEGDGEKYQCGVCIEVVEHLTPQMLTDMFSRLARVSSPNALYLLNSGFADYVQEGNASYLDPFRRGHILSWSAQGLRARLSPLGFRVTPVRGKTWLTAIEYQSTAPKDEDLTDRIWTALPENVALLTDPRMGSVMKILGLESVRAYLC